MKDVFYEVIDEAKDGYVFIDGEKWPIGFNTVIYDGSDTSKRSFNDSNMSTLVIKDEAKFLKKLEEYVATELEKGRKCIKFWSDEKRNHMKFLISYLMVNASTEDFINPINYINRYVDFLEDDTFSYLNNEIYLKLDGVFEGCKLKIKNSEQSVMMETPNKMEVSIVKDGTNGLLEYKLPDVSYGFSIDGNGRKECYIYSFLNPKEKKNLSEEEIRFNKKINRLLYKVNEGVESTEDEDDISDISKVSPSAVISLISFLTLLKEQGISDIKGVPYLPVRYLSRDIVASEYSGDDKEKLIERNDRIQRNVTDKFIRTFVRAAHHLEDSQVVMFPYEHDEFLHFKLGNSVNTNNDLLNSVVESAENNLKI